MKILIRREQELVCVGKLDSRIGPAAETRRLKHFYSFAFNEVDAVPQSWHGTCLRS
jgi:hypothetical protein